MKKKYLSIFNHHRIDIRTHQGHPQKGVVVSRTFILALFSILIASCTATKPWHSDEHEKWESRVPESEARIDYQLFLIGDTGEPVLNDEDPVLVLLQEKLLEAGNNSSIVFLGDNIYSDGLEPEPEEAKQVAEQKITKTLSSMHAYNGRAFFVAGNHDWYSNFEGLQLQEEFINEYDPVENLSFHPNSGCPGPEEVVLNEKLVLALIDSEWFLAEETKEYAAQEGCEIQTVEESMTELRRLAFEHTDKTLVIAVHHPFFSNGRHGGYFTAKQHIFPLTEFNDNFWLPLPGLGSLYVLLRNLGVSDEDMSGSKNKIYRQQILDAVSDHPNVITAAGHDHNLQYFNQVGAHHVVSGSGSKTSKARKGKKAGFAYSGKGFVIIKFYDNGSVWAEFLTPKDPYADNNPIFRVQLQSNGVS